jgi:hypothetical protein
MKFIILFLSLFLTSCSNYGQLTFVTKLPKKIKENSGIAYYGNDKAWFIEDHGNEDILYQVNFEGDLIKEFKVKNATNEDWEDLTTDQKGNIYISDTGNNENKRKNLVIYKLPNPENEPGDHIDAEKIHIEYPDQNKFPPKKDDLIYDAEALFHYKNSLYIVTKNRTIPFNGKTHIYKVPDTPGHYTAELIASFTPCDTARVCQVTSATISPDNKKLVLLGYGFIWVYSDFEGDDFLNGKLQTIDTGATTQLESICFKNEKTLLLSDEERGKTGQNLYTYTLD